MSITEWLGAKGFGAPVVADGKIHRDSRYGHRSKSAWYVAWAEPFPICIAGDWRTGERWEFKDGTPRNRAEMRQARDMMAAAAATAARARSDKQKHVAIAAQFELQGAAPAASSHPYLMKKGIPPTEGVREQDGALLIPLADIDGTVWGLQRILPDGKKLFLSEQRVAGCLFAIGRVGPTIYICEGFATGASVRQATGAMVLCAFSASNLRRVADAARMKYRRADIIIAGDNDRFTDGNPGAAEAECVARDLCIAFAIPHFTAPVRGTDFNDLALAEGQDEVRRQLQKAIRFAPPDPMRNLDIPRWAQDMLRRGVSAGEEAKACYRLASSFSQTISNAEILDLVMQSPLAVIGATHVEQQVRLGREAKCEKAEASADR
jgi:putative DNA primase/helicase